MDDGNDRPGLATTARTTTPPLVRAVREATGIRGSTRYRSSMRGFTVALPAEIGVARAGEVVPIQLVDSATIVDAAGPVRAVVAFALVLLLGGAILWQYEAFVVQSMDATLTKPLSSVGYGIAAHAVIAFGGAYLGSQLAHVDVAGQNAGGIGLVLGALLVLLAGALGFTVVGVAVLDLLGAGTTWAGLVLGAAIAGVVAGVDPLFAGLGWIAIVSAGIGGRVRNWLHASFASDL